MGFPSPALSPPTLAPWQWSYLGYVFGDGCQYDPDTITGLGTGSVRSGDTDRPRDQGQFIGLDFLGGRDLGFHGQIAAGTSGIIPAIQAVSAVMVTRQVEAPLWVNLPDIGYLAFMCKPRKCEYPADLAYSLGLADLSLQFHASDPRIYFAPSLAPAIGLPTPLGGMTFPATFPLSFGGGSAASIITIVNLGNIEVRPKLVLTGPLTNPTVANLQTGWSLTFKNPNQIGFTLEAGDTLTVDLDTHSVLHLVAGTTVPAPVRNWVVPGSVWPNATGIDGLQPGDNSIEFSSQDAGVVAGTLACQYASAQLI